MLSSETVPKECSRLEEWLNADFIQRAAEFKVFVNAIGLLEEDAVCDELLRCCYFGRSDGEVSSLSRVVIHGTLTTGRKEVDALTHDVYQL